MCTKAFYPVHLCNDGYFNGNSGRLISLLEPTEEMIYLEDIAIGQSNICRFGGQIPVFHSVALHTLLVWDLAPEELKPAALLHDAPEAYLGDVIKPLKVMLAPLYRPIEERFERLIFNKYHVPLSHLTDIKPYDLQALEIENDYLREGKKKAFLTCLDNIREQLGARPVKYLLYQLLLENFGRYEQP